MPHGLRQLYAKAYHELCGTDGLSPGTMAVNDWPPIYERLENVRQLLNEASAELVLLANEREWDNGVRAILPNTDDAMYRILHTRNPKARPRTGSF